MLRPRVDVDEWASVGRRSMQYFRRFRKVWSSLSSTIELNPLDPSPRSQILPSGLLALILLGAVLRFYHIGSAAIWWDEGFSHRWAMLPIKTVIQETSTEDYNPPLYYLMLNGWVRVFGDSEASMRTPSAICSILAIWLTYLVGRLLMRHSVGMVAAACMAVSAYQVYYAQQARSYGLMLVCSLASMYFFIRLLRERNAAVTVGYLLTTAATLYAHVYGVFFLMAQCLVVAVLWIRRENTELTILRGVLIQLALGVLLIPWLLFAMGRAAAADAAFWIEKPTPRFILRSFRKLAGSRPALAMLIAFFALTAVAVFLDWRRNCASQLERPAGKPFSPIGTMAFLLTWLVVPHLAPIILSLVMRPIYVDRYTIGTLPAIYLIVAAGICLLKPRPAAIAAGCIFIGVLAIDLVRQLRAPDVLAAKQLAGYVDANAAPTDVLVFDYHSGGGRNTFDYYSKRDDLQKGFIEWAFAPLKPKYIDLLTEQAHGADTVWLITLDREAKVALVMPEMAKRYRYVTRYPVKRSAHMVAIRCGNTPLAHPPATEPDAPTSDPE